MGGREHPGCTVACGERQYPTSRGGWSTEKMYIFYHSGSRETGDEGWYEGIMPNEDIPSPKLRSMHLTTSIESDREGGWADEEE